MTALQTHDRPATLAQYLIRCPGCGLTGAAHVDATAGVPELVRFVCPGSCPVVPSAVLGHLSS